MIPKTRNTDLNLLITSVILFEMFKSIHNDYILIFWILVCFLLMFKNFFKFISLVRLQILLHLNIRLIKQLT